MNNGDNEQIELDPEFLNGEMPANPVMNADGPVSSGGLLALGLTKRERFAMAAMQGILSNPAIYEDIGKAFEELGIKDLTGNKARENTAIISVKRADALLAALEQD